MENKVHLAGGGVRREVVRLAKQTTQSNHSKSLMDVEDQAGRVRPDWGVTGGCGENTKFVGNGKDQLKIGGKPGKKTRQQTSR